MSKPKLKWSEKEEDADFDAAFKYLSLLCSDRKAHALVKSLRGSKLLEHVDFPATEVLGPAASEDEIQGLIDRLQAKQDINK